MDKLTAREAREIIISGEVFDMTFVTADENKGTGGIRKKEKNFQICGSRHSDKKNGTFTVQQIGSGRSYPITVHWALVEEVNGAEVLI